MGYPVFNTMLRRSGAFTKAVVSGATVRDLSETCLAADWEDWKALGTEVKNGFA